MRFEPSFKVIDRIDALPLAAQLKEEKMFYQSEPDFVYENGGPIARDFVGRLPPSFNMASNVLIDQRIHKLQKGYYPAIPGYHLDWIPRTNKGQDVDLTVIPDYEHVVLILAETSLTEFVAEPVHLCHCLHAFRDHGNINFSYTDKEPQFVCRVPTGNYVYDTHCSCRNFTPLSEPYNKLVDGQFKPTLAGFAEYNEGIKNAKLKTWHVENGAMVYFTSHDWHRPVPAQGNEWRMLIRASRVDHIKPKNEIKTQAQVYIPIEEASW